MDNKIQPFQHFEHGRLDMQFSKWGLDMVNLMPINWEHLPHMGVLQHKESKYTFEIAKICPFYIGQKVAILDGNDDAMISTIEVMKLEDVTDEMAIRCGVEQLVNGHWKHYSPELFFPKKIIKDQADGFPAFQTAHGSFFSLWAKQYGVMEIYRNPWVWKLTFVKC